MKKNLNIAYLNGAEGLHKRGGASSGGSSGGSGNDELKWEYYRIDYEKVPLGDELAYIITKFSDLVNALTLEGFKIISRPDLYYNETKFSKIAGTNMSIYDKDSSGEFIVNNNSWIENIKEWMGFDSIPYLVPITKEEFLTFDDNEDYYPPFKELE